MLTTGCVEGQTAFKQIAQRRQPAVPIKTLARFEFTFQIVNARYERGAMILTSNLGFTERSKIFGDRVAITLLESLLHHVVIVQIEGSDFRFLERAVLPPENLRSRLIMPRDINDHTAAAARKEVPQSRLRADNHPAGLAKSASPLFGNVRATLTPIRLCVPQQRRCKPSAASLPALEPVELAEGVDQRSLEAGLVMG